MFYGRENPRLATAVVAAYVSVLMISVVPLALEVIANANEPSTYRRWFDAIFHGIHTLFIAPFITLLALPAFLVQARAILARPLGSGTGALSLIGLVLQTVVFAVLAVTWWPGRLAYDWPIAPFVTWYQLVGFVPVDHAAFVLEQVVLLAVAEWHRRRRRCDGVGISGETQPLIAS